MSGPWEATVTSVVDGDTLVLAVALGFDVTIHARSRIHGIDAPEKSTPAGKAATNYLRGIAVGTLTVNHNGKDRYGRYLVTLSTPEVPSFADALAGSGHARRWVT